MSKKKKNNNVFYDSKSESDSDIKIARQYPEKIELGSDESDDDKLEDRDPYDEEELDTFDKNCLYRYVDNENEGEGEGDSEVNIIDEDFEDNNDTKDSSEQKKKTSLIVPDDERITKPILNKYERVRVMGDRTQQLSAGAKPMIKDVEHLSPQEIAQLELDNNVLPFIIYRPLANGKIERWKLSELKK